MKRRTLLFGFPAFLRAQKPLDSAYEIARGSSKNGGLVVQRCGEIVFEKYFGLGSREAAPNLASIGKSVTSIAAGILVGERPYLFPAGLDQKVYTVRHLPKEAFPMNDSRKSGIKLGHLLTMTSGISGNSPAIILGKHTSIDPVGPDGWEACVDATAAATSLWCSPGSGYCYATAGVHLVSMMIRRITGMELQSYVADRLAGPLGWSGWGYGYKRPEVNHTPGGGGIQLRSADVLPFGDLLLGEGRWNGDQIVPVEYAKACGRLSPYNPHSAYSLQFDVNGDGHVADVPRDAFWKTASGGHCLCIIPSMEMVIWKLGGRDGQYAESAPNGEPWTPKIEPATAALRVLQLCTAAFV